ncbi:MAG: hypothetical protein RLZZ507_902 [Cyanobacteriota bacterium]|jgi:hypothetical protein
MTTNAELFLLTVPLTAANHECAKRFASEQSSREKFKQVYLNTLAVLAVDRFLRWMEFETDLNAADSWNPIIRRFNNVADLMLPELGRVECRPILPTEDVMILPPEVIGDRIAYIAVKFAENLKQVELLGFLPASESIEESDIIDLADLQPLEELTDFLLNLDPISEDDFEEEEDDETEGNNLSIEVLRRWLEQNYGEGWKAYEEIQGEGGYRSDDNFEEIRRRAKVIEIEDYSVVLSVLFTSEHREDFRLIFKLEPEKFEYELPEGVELQLLDQNGQLIQEDNSEEPEIEWNAKIGTLFNIQIILGEARFIEQFQI